MKNKLPTTRYYGSKRKIINQIWDFISSENLEFDSVLDLFGGTGTFAYKAKLEGKQVFYNDIFKFNSIIGKALLQNNSHKIKDYEINFVLQKDSSYPYKYNISENFKNIYYLNHENEQIDIMIQNINRLKENYSKYIAFYSLFQVCLIKRPFNTFHRKNLNLRTNDVKREFGNKTTWEKDISEAFKQFCEEANSYIINNHQKNFASNKSALKCEKKADLVYIDPPYVSKKSYHVNYHSRYHFLEALVNYDTFADHINHEKLNHEVQINKSTEFESKSTITKDIERIIIKHKNSIIVFSYRNDGIPSIKELKSIFLKNNMDCSIHLIKTHNYALHRKNKSMGEFVFISKPKKITNL